MSLNQPGSSIKFTNVSQVRMRKGKKRYEIVCYQNKVQDWRRGVEKDLDEVVQIQQVFVNVGKGEVASSQDLKEAFGTSDVEKVVLEILNKGELQVGEKERAAQASELHNTILQMVAGGCMNPRTKKPYPVSILRKALNMLDFKFSTKPAKSQAMDALTLLVDKQLIPIVRASMRVLVADDVENAKKYADVVKELMEIEREEETGNQWELVGKIDPGDFRKLEETIQRESGGTGVLDALSVDY